MQHSTVSRRLRAFEDQLGVRLFDRKRGGYELTAAGEDLKGAATRMEREALSVDGLVLGRDEHLHGTLRVSTADAMATTFLMPIFTDFASAYPDVDLRVMVSNDYISLSQREADVAIRASNSPPDNLIGHRISQLAFAVYGERAHVEALLREGTRPTWIGAEGGMPHQPWIDAQAKDHAVALVVDEATLTHAALRRGGCVGLMPCFMGDADPQLRRFSDPVHQTALDLWVLIHGDLRRTARVRVFSDFVTAAIRDQRTLLKGHAPL